MSFVASTNSSRVIFMKRPFPLNYCETQLRIKPLRWFIVGLSAGPYGSYPPVPEIDHGTVDKSAAYSTSFMTRIYPGKFNDTARPENYKPA